MDATRYKDLMDAAKILAKARMAVGTEDDYLMSPPWTMLANAFTHIHKQADAEMRGTAEDSQLKG